MNCERLKIIRLGRGCAKCERFHKVHSVPVATGWCPSRLRPPAPGLQRERARHGHILQVYRHPKHKSSHPKYKSKHTKYKSRHPRYKSRHTKYTSSNSSARCHQFGKTAFKLALVRKPDVFQLVDAKVCLRAT